MKQRCEVCENFRPDAKLDPAMKFVEVSFGERRVALCRAHARIAQNSGVSSFDELRDLYGKGRRSFIARRDPATSSASDDRPRSPGRRAEDQRGASA
ncbi:MAG TPA: hypothetical protein VK524_09970 [Polyangiaceae bacterium]|nr:hypothetical protein [Polyangiaceae bacterium]